MARGAVLSAVSAGMLLVAFGLAASAAPPVERKSGVQTSTKKFDADRFAHAFRGQREDVRLKALQDLEAFHLADAAAPEALWRVIEAAAKLPRVPPSILRALQLYARIDNPEGFSKLTVLLGAADPSLVLAAVDVLGERRPDGALPALTALRERPAYAQYYALRHGVVSAVGRFPEPASVDFLIGTVENADGQLKYAAAIELARLTGQSFGGRGAEWKKWWQQQGGKLPDVSASAARQPPQSLAWDGPVPQFYGTPIYAKRVVFVIDRSKSMLSSVDGVTRLDDASKQLEGAVRGLADDAWFEIVAYNETELPFAGRLVQATPQAKSDAARFIYALSADGKTDSFSPLSDALRVDPNVEAILFLSDGEPNAGAVVDRATIVAAVTQQNKALRASINTIGIDARGAGEAFLQQLAGNNFGTFQSIR
jgi:hypothetical protein